jgi:predicted dehydrogenase
LLAAGVAVLVEKPFASTVAEGVDLIERARRANRSLTVGHIERFNPAIVELKRRLDAGELGRIFQIHATRVGPFPARIRDVGVVIDLATHDLDLMRYLLNQEAVRVYAETDRNIHTAHEDILSGVIKFSGGAVGVLDINWLTPTKRRTLTVTGEKGMFLANYLTQDLTFFENRAYPVEWQQLSALTGVAEGASIRFALRKEEPLRAELAAFVESVRHGTPVAVSGAEGLEALRLAQAVVEAGRSTRVMELAPKE